jgi:hypothetical protein
MAGAGRRDGGRVLFRVASVAVLALAVSVLSGWWLDHPGLRSGIAGLIAMNPATAIAFVLASVALRLRLTEFPPPPARFAARLCAAAVVLVPLLRPSRLFTRWDLGPDRLLFAEQLARVDGARPNRMAPNTAFNFLLLGASGYSEEAITRLGSQGAPPGPLIEKPFIVQGLLAQVRRVLSAETPDA